MKAKWGMFMTEQKKNTIITSGIAVLAVILAYCFRIVGRGSFYPMLFSYLRSFIYIGLFAGGSPSVSGSCKSRCAGFGGATLAILWQGLTNVTGMSIGSSSLIVAVAMIIFALFYDRKQINIGTILYQIIYSFFVDVFTKFSIIQILKRLILL